MPTFFPTWNAFWAFSREIKFGSRFLHSDLVHTFLQAVAESAEKRCYVLPADKALWRAQLGHDWRQRSQDDVTWDEPAPLKAERMIPLRYSAHEGRVNPKGIPCLYVANKKETAVAEVRPWLGALVSVAQMRVTRDLRLVNCCDGHNTNFDFYVEEPPPEEREAVVWREIGRAFSNPASLDPGIAEYVPTQVLAEHFRKLQYDGVVYKSKLGPDYNIAVFDLNALEIVDVRLYPVKAVHYEIGEVEDSYVIKHKLADT